MNKKIKQTVYQILLQDEYSRNNDNYLIVRVAQILDPELAGSKFINLRFSKLSMEGITRARRSFFKEFPELKPKEMTKIREQEEIEYHIEYGNENHIPFID